MVCHGNNRIAASNKFRLIFTLIPLAIRTVSIRYHGLNLIVMKITMNKITASITIGINA